MVHVGGVEAPDTVRGRPLAEQAVFEVRSELVRYLVSSGCAPDDAEDVASECCTVMLRRLTAYDPVRGTPLQWASGFAKRIVGAKRRRAAREARTAPSAPQQAEGIDVGAIALRSAVQKLDAMDQQLISLAFGVGLTSKEIADRTSLTPDAVRKRLSRAVERMRTDPALAGLDST